MFKIRRSRRLIAQVIGVVVAGGSLAIAVATSGSAVTFGPPTPVPFNQQGQLPITASNFDSHGTDCGNASNMDGWAFVVPPADPNQNIFVSLTVTFSPGGTQTITTFGPPNDAHAFVFSAPGAQLTAASATIETATGANNPASFFNLSHTCPATSTTSPSPSPSPKPSGSPSPSGSPHPSGSPSTPPPGAPPPTPVHTNLPVTG